MTSEVKEYCKMRAGHPNRVAGYRHMRVYRVSAYFHSAARTGANDNMYTLSRNCNGNRIVCASGYQRRLNPTSGQHHGSTQRCRLKGGRQRQMLLLCSLPLKAQKKQIRDYEDKMEKASDGIVESDALAIDSVARMIGHPSQQLSRVLVLFGVTTASS